MSVYTSINQQQLIEYLTQYSLGKLLDFSGIQAGIENTNYTVKTTQGLFVLTLFESLTAEQLPYFLRLLKHLRNNGFPAPEPQVCDTGLLLSQLKGKPAAFFELLPGQSTDIPSIKQCNEIGGYLAKLHLYSKNYTFTQQNTKNLTGCQTVFEKIKPYLQENDYKLAQSELNFQSNFPLLDLPKGIIHADLFRDNVLFDKQGHISGILDFYNACHDIFLFDIAVTCNDWCIEKGIVQPKKMQALLTGYKKLRPFNEDETIHFPVVLRLTALRFWLSRLDHQLNPVTGELTLEKDPLVFRRILHYHRSHSAMEVL